MLRLMTGHRYTTNSVIKMGDMTELKKIAKSENRRFRKQHRLDRCVVYPVSGPMPNMGQLCILR